MGKNVAAIKEKILAALLPNVPFDGWTREAAEAAAVECGYGPEMVRAVFPGGVGDILDYFSQWVDARMMHALAEIDPGSLKIRERIKVAVMARFAVLNEHKDAEKLAVAYWALPGRHLRAGRIIWRTADVIWTWAGDTAQDYNHYTKRGLLSGILGSAKMVFIGDESGELDITGAFVDRRIENVMQFGRIIGKIKKAS